MTDAVSHRFEVARSAWPKATRTVLPLIAAMALIANCPAQAESSSAVLPLDQAATHWSFQPLKRIDPPLVKNLTWAKTAIDKFILAKSEEQGLQPAPPAGKRILL